MNERESNVGTRLAFSVEEPARFALQVAPASTAGTPHDERLDVLLDGSPVDGVLEFRAAVGGRTLVFTAGPGELVIVYAGRAK